jgi:hypothetical protein
MPASSTMRELDVSRRYELAPIPAWRQRLLKIMMSVCARRFLGKLRRIGHGVNPRASLN